MSSLDLATQQLVIIARALAQDARVLILDEPTAALTESESRIGCSTACARFAAKGVADHLRLASSGRGLCDLRSHRRDARRPHLRRSSRPATYRGRRSSRRWSARFPRRTSAPSRARGSAQSRLRSPGLRVFDPAAENRLRVERPRSDGSRGRDRRPVRPARRRLDRSGACDLRSVARDDARATIRIDGRAGVDRQSGGCRSARARPDGAGSPRLPDAGAVRRRQHRRRKPRQVRVDGHARRVGDAPSGAGSGRRAPDQDAVDRCRGAHALGRQPAEGAGGALARRRRAHPRADRSDARRRCRRAQRDQAHLVRPEPAGPRDPDRLDRQRGACRRLRPGHRHAARAHASANWRARI